MEIQLNDQERRTVGKLLMERRARLVEMTEDTTEPDLARRAGLIELLTINSAIRKLRCAMSPIDAVGQNPINQLDRFRRKADVAVSGIAAR